MASRPNSALGLGLFLYDFWTKNGFNFLKGCKKERMRESKEEDGNLSLVLDIFKILSLFLGNLTIMYLGVLSLNYPTRSSLSTLGLWFIVFH